MAFQKRVIILSDTNTKHGVGIVKLITYNDKTTCEISINEPKNTTFDIVIKCDDNTYNFTAQNEKNFDIDVCSFTSFDILVLLNNKPYLVGTNSGDKYKSLELQNTLKKLKIQDEKAHIQSIPNEEILEEKTEENSTCNTENIVPQNTEKYDDIIDIKEENVIENISYSGEDFYIAIKPQIDEMFICFPRDTILENTVPNSKWVRVENADETYVVGIIYELDTPKYLVYGIPKDKHTPPPEDIKNICDWLPLSLDNVDGAGFYLIYQDAKTGKTIKNN